ncbi:MAG: hypothetical protein QS721_13065 [Candidatus Endonucleobacter sp. (ex Gigantidas childressi)]|nr:hypothetical protein [Candidatus Endonucleobacter sp. (ex Gigantidas childressi)]
MRKGTTIHLEAFRILTKCFSHMTTRDVLFLLEIYWRPRQSPQELCERTGNATHELGEFQRRFGCTKEKSFEGGLVLITAGKVSGRQELQLTVTGEGVARSLLYGKFDNQQSA